MGGRRGRERGRQGGREGNWKSELKPVNSQSQCDHFRSKQFTTLHFRDSLIPGFPNNPNRRRNTNYLKDCSMITRSSPSQLLQTSGDQNGYITSSSVLRGGSQHRPCGRMACLRTLAPQVLSWELFHLFEPHVPTLQTGIAERTNSIIGLLWGIKQINTCEAYRKVCN